VKWGAASRMKILALEFSPVERSVAVLIDGEVRGHALDGQTQQTHAFDCVRSALEQAGLSAPEIECVAVGLGPGSYAGTRIAIAMAQGWALARNVKLLGVSSADSIARQINDATESARFLSDVPRLFNVVFDAQRNETYAIQYLPGASEPRMVGSFELLTPDEEKRRRDAGEAFFKADRGPWRLDTENVVLSDARTIGRMAAQRTDFIAGHELEPIYLRKAEFVKVPSIKSKYIG